MKRILLLLVLVMAGVTVSAQEAPILIPERQIVVVDNFTAVPNITLGLYQYARQCVIEGLAKKRISVIDVEAEGYGRADIVYPSYRRASGNTGRPYDINRMEFLMNDYPQARWYLTAYLSKFNSHPVNHESKDKDGKPVVKTDYTCIIEAEIYLFDRETATTEGPIRWHYTYTGASTPLYAEETAIENLGYKARSMASDYFRFKASVIQLGEYNRRGKLQDLYLSCGSDMDVSNGDVFYIYSVSDVNGISTARKLGKVKAREITGRESCRCSVSNGEAEIDQAFKNGEILIAVSDTDRYF